MTQVLVDLNSRPGRTGGIHLILTDEGAHFTNQAVYPWNSITRVRYSAVEQRVNGAYMGTRFSIELGDADRYSPISVIAGLKGALRSQVDNDGREAASRVWHTAVGIIDQRVCERLVAQAVQTVLNGGTVEMARLRLDRDGVHKRGLFGSRTIRWADVAGTDMKNGYFRILARNGAATKPRIEVHMGEWNQVLLPSAIATLAQHAR